MARGWVLVVDRAGSARVTVAVRVRLEGKAARDVEVVRVVTREAVDDDSVLCRSRRPVMTRESLGRWELDCDTRGPGLWALGLFRVV